MNGLDVNKFKKFLFDMYNDIEALVTPGHRIEIEKSVLASYVFKIDECRSVHFRSIVQYNEEEIKHISITVFSNICDESLQELFARIEKRFIKELNDASKQGEAALDYINEFIDKLLGIATFKSVESHSWTTKNYRFGVYVNKENLSLSISDIHCGGYLLSQDIPDYEGFPCRESVVKDIENFFLFFFSNHSISYTKDRNELIGNLKERYGLDFSYERREED